MTMCIIIVKPYNQVIPETVLEKSLSQNQDGFGLYAYSPEMGGKVYRTIHYNNYFKPQIDKYNKEEYFLIAHYRLTSAGNNNLKNVHPFNIRKGWWMFHNGHFEHAYYHRFKSDTNIVSDALKKIKYPDQNIPAICHMMDNMTDSRLVFVKNDDYHIVNEPLGKWSGGIWYSQTGPIKTIPLFVYGTLKEGGSNHYSYLREAQKEGRYKTVNKYGLRVNGAPALTKESYDNIKGELYYVDEEELAKIDELEGHPSLYQRELIRVKSQYGNLKEYAWAYFRDVRTGKLQSEYQITLVNRYNNYGYDPHYYGCEPHRGQSDNFNRYNYNDDYDDDYMEDYNYEAIQDLISELALIDSWDEVVYTFEDQSEEKFPESQSQTVYALLGFHGYIEDGWPNMTLADRTELLDNILLENNVL